MGKLGKLAAPLAGTGLDPVGKWTNKQLGLVEEKKVVEGPSPLALQTQQRAADSDAAARAFAEDEERRRAALAADSSNRRANASVTVLGQAMGLGE